MLITEKSWNLFKYKKKNEHDSIQDNEIAETKDFENVINSQRRSDGDTSKDITVFTYYFNRNFNTRSQNIIPEIFSIYPRLPARSKTPRTAIHKPY